MNIRPITKDDRPHWVRLRDALWPGSLAYHESETRAYFEEKATTPVVFVAEVAGQVVGFVELEFRSYAPGCASSPVPFIEGWYVEPARQGNGIGRALIEAVEAHARTLGFREIASDVDLTNANGIAAHRALGFEAVERLACFRRSLTERSP